MKWTDLKSHKSLSKPFFVVILLILNWLPFSDLLQGSVQELDLDSDEDEDEAPTIPSSRIKGLKSKQWDRPSKIIPTGSDDSSSDEDEEDEDGPVTMANMEARSRALDEKAAREAQLDLEEVQDAARAGGEEDDDFEGGEEGEEGEETEGFQLPTAEEVEEEKKVGGPQVHVVQRRMRECVRILDNFKKRATPGRYVDLQMHYGGCVVT